MNIQIIVGSVRENRMALKIAEWMHSDIAKENNDQISSEIVDLKTWDLAIFSGANPPASGIYDQPKQKQWSEQISKGDAFIIISPEYNHGYSPALKNALDYLSAEWKNKPAAYVSYGASHGSRSIDQIRQVGTAMGLIDSNATMEIRDIFQRNKEAAFTPNQFEVDNLKQIINQFLLFSRRD